jgi:hypothetical protein
MKGKNYGFGGASARYLLEMKWVFIGVAVALFLTWPIFRVVLAIPLGVLNVLWMLAIMFVIMWAAQRFA